MTRYISTRRNYVAIAAGIDATARAQPEPIRRPGGCSHDEIHQHPPQLCRHRRRRYATARAQRESIRRRAASLGA